MRCPRCESKVTRKNKFCQECGTAIVWGESDNLKEVQTKSRCAIVILSILLVVSLAVIGVLFASKNNGGGTTGRNETTQQAGGFADNPTAISETAKSVVKLNCYDKNDDLYATGSGFACFSENVIVTNYHVIEGNVYRIEASTEDGQTFDIPYVLSADKEKDIAILATLPYKPHGVPLLEVGNSYNLQKGEKVIAIGSPLGLLNSVSTGVFSGYTNETGMDVLQFTAAISSGSSGGALFNDAGEVVGVTFASYESGQNLNLAIPIGYVERLYSQAAFENRQIIEEFYKTNVPTYTVDQVMALGDSLNGEIFYIEGYYHSHEVVGDYAAIWLNLQADIVNGGRSVKVGYIPKEKMPLWIFTTVAYMESLDKGALIKVRCTYDAESIVYVMLEALER